MPRQARGTRHEARGTSAQLREENSCLLFCPTPTINASPKACGSVIIFLYLQLAFNPLSEPERSNLNTGKIRTTSELSRRCSTSPASCVKHRSSRAFSDGASPLHSRHSHGEREETSRKLATLDAAVRRPSGATSARRQNIASKVLSKYDALSAKTRRQLGG